VHNWFDLENHFMAKEWGLACDFAIPGMTVMADAENRNIASEAPVFRTGTGVQDFNSLVEPKLVPDLDFAIRSSTCLD
jgi:hypothetical protein